MKTLFECYEAAIPCKKAAKLCDVSYAIALRKYTEFRFIEFAPEGQVKRNIREVGKIERDLFALIAQAETQKDPFLAIQIENQKILYSQFDALSLTQTI